MTGRSVRARGIDSGSYLHGLSWRIATRFALGEWDGALADQAEFERIAALAPGELPHAYAMGPYTRVALCRELRGEHDDADRYIDVGLDYYEARRHLFARGASIHLGPLARTLASRGRFDEALAVIPLVPRSSTAGVTLEALCEIAAMRERWDEAGALVAAAREQRPRSESSSPSRSSPTDSRAGRRPRPTTFGRGLGSSPGPPRASPRSGRAGKRRGLACCWRRWSPATASARRRSSQPRSSSSSGSAPSGR
jgi:hypothetical protein